MFFFYITSLKQELLKSTKVSMPYGVRGVAITSSLQNMGLSRWGLRRNILKSPTTPMEQFPYTT